MTEIPKSESLESYLKKQHKIYCYAAFILQNVSEIKLLNVSTLSTH